MDFGTASAADYTRLQSEISKLEIGVLYNNVGVSYDYAEALQNIPEEKVGPNTFHPAVIMLDVVQIADQRSHRSEQSLPREALPNGSPCYARAQEGGHRQHRLLLRLHL